MRLSTGGSTVMGNTAPVVVMRAPKITVISPQSYQSEYWPKISAALIEILHYPEKRIQQEELYRTVYNVCCQRHQITLYNDTMKVIREHLAVMRQELLATTEHNFLSTFARTFVRYRQAIDVLCVGFRYLERVYLTEKLGTTFLKVLQDAYLNAVLNPPNEPPEIKRRLQITLQHFRPPVPDPSTFMHLTKGLYALNKEYATFNLGLFALYVPCLQPARGLAADLQETHTHLRILSLLPRGDGSGKRTFDDMQSL